MAKEIDLYPGVVYQTKDNSYRVVFDQFPFSESVPQESIDYTVSSNFYVFSIRTIDQLKLHPNTLGTASPEDIVKLLSPISRDEMIHAIDFSGIPQHVWPHFQENMTTDIDANIAKGTRRILAPNIE